MAKNVIVCIFEVESEAYQALTELKQAPGNEKSLLSQAVLVKKENGTIRSLDSFDTGAETMNDTAIGGLTGAMIGILGGPIGILLGGAYGALIGSTFDSADTLDNISVLEDIAGKLDDGDVAIIGLAVEEDESVLDCKLQKYKAIIARFDAAAAEEEVAQAREMEFEMARQARRELRAEKRSELKEQWENKKAEASAKKETKKSEKEAKKAAKKAAKKVAE